LFDGPVESGGVLLSHPSRPLEIRIATGPGEAKLGRNALHLDLEEAADATRQNPGLAVCGDWHIHLNSNDLPSPTDRRAWARMLEADGVEVVVGIVVAAENAWTRELHAWLTFRECGHVVCERAHLREKSA
jgi:hypothetical protein